VRDPEGLLSTVPAVSTALLGVLTGHWLRRREPTGELKTLGLVAAGVAALALGALWYQVFPVNKNLWTSSFVLWTAGWSLLLLAVFYFVIDVRGRGEWAFPLVVIGSNAIAIYLLHRFVDFEELVAWAVPSALGDWGRVLRAAGALAVEWLILWGLWRRRWFLRV
jgi:predicted acyltransferase